MRLQFSPTRISSRAALNTLRPSLISNHHVTASTLLLQRQVSSTTHDEHRRIYIQGAGNTGRLLAVGLSLVRNPPPITIVLHTPRRFRQFLEGGRKVSIINVLTAEKYEVDNIDVELRVEGGFLTTHLLDENEIPTSSTAQESGKIGQPASKSKLPPPIPSDRALRRGIAPPGVHFIPLDKAIKLRPILNYITDLPTSNGLEQLESLAPRLQRRSAILLLQPVMGMVERAWNQPLFKNPRTRPSLAIGGSTHELWEAVRYNEGGYRFKDDIRPLEDIQLFEDSASFASNWSGEGGCALAPVICPPGEQALEYQYRVEAFSFLHDKIRESPLLNGYNVSRQKNLQYRMESLAMESILGPMCTILGCTRRDVLDDDSKVAVALTLLKETCAVMSVDIPSITVQSVFDKIQRNIRPLQDNLWGGEGQDRTSKMLVDMILGKPSHLDYLNGWIVQRGKILGIPCPAHEKMVELLKEKGAEHARKLSSKRRTASESNTQTYLEVGDKEKKRQEREEKREYTDRLMVKRLKKEQRQRDALGKQPIPDYHQPKIQGLGGMKK